ncbi:MAG: TonB-dependent receptor [Candidatus Kapabacteria bacterium]|jgi:iron complex outermembrane receptor protein|nr:TonB-dependent receptor [Candidatus Kapabacteria bacterium]
MNKIIISILVFSIALVSNLSVSANTKGGIDTLKTYKMGRVIKNAYKERKNILPSVVNTVEYDIIQKRDASSVAELGLLIPAATIQTNSRGETLLYLRGAGERQLGLFLDGVLLNIPWDNRADLSLIPTDIICKMNVNKGMSSVLYGANILGGAVNISTVERAFDGLGGTLRTQYDDGGGKLLSLTNDGRYGDFNYLLNFSYYSSDGMLMTAEDSDKELDNQLNDSRLRTNTDMERYNLYARTEYHFSEYTKAAVSFNHIDASKGVAPLTEEQDGSARFWRIPEWKRTVLTLNASHEFTAIEDLFLSATLWHDNFAQTIDSYTDISYEDLEESSLDDDRTIGTRIALDYDLAKNHLLTFAFNGTMSDHTETITDIDTTAENEYQQNIMSIGAEYTGSFDELSFHTGASFDLSQTPKTGVFTDSENSSIADYGAFAGARYRLTKKAELFTTLARRTRFPTLRESFSGALGKFLVNPDLGPETGINYEFGSSFNYDRIQFEITGFTTFYDDMIEKVPVAGTAMKQRVNYASALVCGIESAFRWRPISKLTVSGHFTYLYSEGENNDGEFVRHLEYKPDYIGSISSYYRFGFGLRPMIEVILTGRQYGENSRMGELQEIDPTATVNARIGYEYMYEESMMAEFFLSVKNIADTPTINKIGLPGAGRIFSTGLIIRI